MEEKFQLLQKMQQFKKDMIVKKVVCAKNAHTTKQILTEGKTQDTNVKYYNLDAILSIGYPINSKRGKH